MGAFIIIIGVFGYFALNYFNAVDCAAAYEFAEAGESIGQVPFAADIFPDDFAYIEAGMNMEVRNYDKAMSVLQKLEGDDAGELLKEVKYRKAAKLANDNNFDGAVEIYKQIKDYKDSKDLINDTTFRKANYLINQSNFKDALEILNGLFDFQYPTAHEKINELYYIWGNSLIEKEEYLEAYNKFKLAGDYEDASTIINDLKEVIYFTAIDMYHTQQYSKAKDWLSSIGNYQQSNSYITLCEAHLNEYITYETLESLIGFEDTNELIISNSYFSYEFLTGRWRGDSKYFNMDSDGYISFDIPWFSYGDYYRIENGLLCFIIKIHQIRQKTSLQ